MEDEANEPAIVSKCFIECDENCIECEADKPSVCSICGVHSSRESTSPAP